MVLAALVMAGCDPVVTTDAGPDVPVLDGALDTPRPDAEAPRCVSDDECDDGAFCNGVERCRPLEASADAFGCIAGTSGCLAGQTCLEIGDRCVTECAVASDADGDGATAAECGGTDCDDADPRARPGLIEVCDADGRDEDCDPATLGGRDADGDGAVDALCCNGARCGVDCNDGRADIRPDGTEVCDGLDQDCNGTVDEGTLAPGYPDLDGDLHGDNGASAAMACAGAAHRASVADDCDDTDPTVHAAQPEFLDGLDNDCDGDVDEDVAAVTWYADLDGDGFGNAAGGTTRSEIPVEGFSVLSSDCDDGRAMARPSASELCNGLDDDCDGIAGFVIDVGDLEDDDGDGVVDAACPLGLDCNDLDATTRPGVDELCDSRDNDCNGTVDDGITELAWLLDRDGDGVGDDRSPPIYTCELVPGRVLLSGDCDDEDVSRRPGAFDACTRPDVDDDCDGAIDEAGAIRPFFVDADGDGAGFGAARLSCAAATGLSVRDDDCDDADGARSPSASELCAGGVDEDCDGAVDCEDSECAGTADCTILYTLEVVSGGGQTARIVGSLAAPLRLRLREGATPRAGRSVTLRSPEGAAPSTATLVTDAAGEVSFAVTLGRLVGTQTFSVSAVGALPITIDATASAPSAGTVHTLLDTAGTAGTVAAADGPASAARPMGIDAIEVGIDGTLFVADAAAHAVYAISPRGALRRIAGTGAAGSAGDGGMAIAATLSAPSGLALDASTGRLFIADAASHRVRVVNLGTGVIDTYAGNGSAVDSDASDLAARIVPMPSPRALTLADGSDLIVLLDGGRIREIDGATGSVRELHRFAPGSAGLCERGCDVAVAAGGDVLVAGRIEEFCGGMGMPNYGVYRLGSHGLRVAGECYGLTADGITARVATLGRAASLAIAPSGDLLVAAENRLVRLAARTTRSTTIAGQVGGGGVATEDASALAARFGARAIAVLGTTVYFADGPRLRAVSQLAPTTTTDATVTVTPPPESTALDELYFEVTVSDGAALREAVVIFEAVSAGLDVWQSVAVTSPTGVTYTYGALGRRVGLQTVRTRYLDLHGRDAVTPLDTAITVRAPGAGEFLRIFNSGRSFDTTETSTDPPLSGVPGIASQAYGGMIRGVAAAADGTVYFSVSHRVVAVSPEGLATVIAGGGTQSDPGMDVASSEWRIGALDSLALDEGAQILYALAADRSMDPPGVFAIDLASRRVRHLFASSGPRPARVGPYPPLPVGSGNLSVRAGVLRSGWLTVDPTTGAMTAAAIPEASGMCGPGTATHFEGGAMTGAGVLADGTLLALTRATRDAPCDCLVPGLYLAENMAGTWFPRAGGCGFDDTLSNGAFSIAPTAVGDLRGCASESFPWVQRAGTRILMAPLDRFYPACRRLIEVDLAAGTAVSVGPTSDCIEAEDTCSYRAVESQVLTLGPTGAVLIEDIRDTSSFIDGQSGAVGQFF
jgi:hypothetical protein